jgi:hypothetical protein
MPRSALKKIVQENPDIVKDEQRLKSMFADLCPKPEDKRYVNAIRMAQSHVVAQMAGSRGSEPTDILLPRLTHVLVDSTGLPDDLAGWAVSAWAEALGIATNWQPPVAKTPPKSVTLPPKPGILSQTTSSEFRSDFRVKDIFIAARIGKFKDMKYLIETKGVNVNAKDSDGCSLLHIAVRDNSCTDVLKYLIEQGADVNALNKDGETPLDFAEHRGGGGLYLPDTNESRGAILRAAGGVSGG